ncbi:hypothetical protein BKA69DRAFT_78189 [Paraphysoderma sedebokerense]|nr:hypothetical protein BKA69DRAFT_78189 [Paraphysoderma sedebokerense]
MQIQLASLALIVALISTSNSAPIIPAPIAALPFAAKAAIGSAAVGTVVGTAAWINHGKKSEDKQRHATMTFVTPDEKSVYTCGQPLDIVVNTFGMGSFWGISTAKFTLIDAQGKAVSEVMKQKLSRFLHEERTMGMGRARNGKGEFSWTIPETITSGNYKLEFESFNALNMDRSRKRFVSPSFHIACNSQPQEGEPIAP